MKPKIGIVGCGWLGLRLGIKLSEQFEVYVTTTTAAKIDSLNSKGLNPTLASFVDYQLPEKMKQWDVVKDLDVVVITIPVSGKNCCASSLYNRIGHLFSFLGDFKGQIFLMSSTGVYPDIAKEYTETDVPVDDIAGERMIKNKYPQVNILRLAGLMGDARLLCNYPVSNLDFAVNHIHYADIIAVIKTMITQGSRAKIYNVVAPLHPTKEAVINAQKNLPTDVKETPKGKIISSAKMIAELNFTFQYPDPRFFHLCVFLQ